MVLLWVAAVDQHAAVERGVADNDGLDDPAWDYAEQGARQENDQGITEVWDWAYRRKVRVITILAP